MDGTEAETKPEGFDYDSIEPGYYDEVFRRGKGVQSAWHRLKFAHVAKALPQDFARHLDVGCGPGTFIGTLPERGESLGVDLASAQIAYATGHYATSAHRFECVNAGELPHEAGTFDVVTAVELIEHLEPDHVQDLLRDSLRVLRPGGRIVITTPNYGSLWPLLERIVNRLGGVSYEEQHINLFRKRLLRQTLQRAGFDDVRVTTFQGLAPFAAALHNGLASAIQSVENPLLAAGGGFLLMGQGRKPAGSPA